jgi:rubrerythrin
MRSRRERAIEILGKGLRVEYRAIFLYRIHARAIRDKEARERLLEFGEMEAEHATLLGEKLVELGGTITWSFKPGEELKKPLRQILEEHGEAEREAIAVYTAARDERLGPEYDKLFSRLIKDEQYHKKVLAELLARMRG